MGLMKQQPPNGREPYPHLLYNSTNLNKLAAVNLYFEGINQFTPTRFCGGLRRCIPDTIAIGLKKYNQGITVPAW